MQTTAAKVEQAQRAIVARFMKTKRVSQKPISTVKAKKISKASAKQWKNSHLIKAEKTLTREIMRASRGDRDTIAFECHSDGKIQADKTEISMASLVKYFLAALSKLESFVFPPGPYQHGNKVVWKVETLAYGSYKKWTFYLHRTTSTESELHVELFGS